MAKPKRMPFQPRLCGNEKVICRGGNQTGRYAVICSGKFHWRLWADIGQILVDRQTYVGKCDCSPRVKGSRKVKRP